MNTYTLAQRPRSEADTGFELTGPQVIPDLPLMTLPQARKALELATANGHDLVIYNTQAL